MPNFPVKINLKTKVLAYFVGHFDPYAFQDVLDAGVGVVRPADGKVLKAFYLLQETRYCNDEFGYLGWGDELPPTYSVKFDFEEVKRQFQSVEEYNRDPDSTETIYLRVTRIIPKPLQKRDNGRVIHKEF
jgi:hypothetical protein